MTRGRRLLLAALVVSAAVLTMSPARATPAEDNFASQLFALINQQRANVGHSTLRPDASLAAGAQTTADYNRDHVGQPGCEDACHRPQGNEHFEIVYWGVGTTASPQEAIETWMNSPQHKANLLSTGATAGGVGVAINPDTGRTWAVTWFNGGDTLPAPDAPGGTPPTTKKVAATPTTKVASPTTTPIGGATTTTAAAPTTSSTSETSTTSSSTTSTTTENALTLRNTAHSGEDGSNLLVRGVVGALIVGGAGMAFLAIRRRRSAAD